jgi:hypothetical protein
MLGPLKFKLNVGHAKKGPWAYAIYIFFIIII